MPRFPSRESDVAALATEIINGLRNHAEDFPAPPLGVEDLQASLDAYMVTHEAAVEAQGAAAEAFDDKDEALQSLIDGMRAVLRYAEDATQYHDGKLKKLGWGARKPRSELQVPGQAGVLEVKREGPGWVYLDWKKPADGGVVAVYHVQVLRKGEEDDAWRDVATCFDTMAVLSDQDRGIELRYRVVTANRAGRGVPSNAVAVSL